MKISTHFSFLYSLCLNGIIFSNECRYDENNILKINCLLTSKFKYSQKMTNLEKLYNLCFDILEIVVFSKIRD